MGRSSWGIWVLITILSPLIFVFNNCAPAVFTNRPYSPISNPPGGPNLPPNQPVRLLDMVLETAMNTPISWNMAYQGSRSGHDLSFQSHSVVTTLAVTDQSNPSIPAGTVIVEDPNQWRLKYTPQTWYRGTVQFLVYALDSSGSVLSQATVTIHVGRDIKQFRPALAVRAGGCVMCHAQVYGNIITDFGFDDSYYFGRLLPPGLKWNDGAAYGDHDAFVQYTPQHIGIGAWARLKAQNGSSLVGSMQVFVPQGAGQIPTEATAKTGATSLQGYLRHRFLNSPYDSTKQLAQNIVTRSGIFIGAPSPNILLTAFQWDPSVDGTSGYRFVPENGSSFPLQGLIWDSSRSLAYNDSLFICEGDLLVVGSLRINQLNLRSRTGCRIYVTEDVYIHGPIQFDRNTPHNYDKTNLQIVSARAILMGLGSLWLSGQHCENDQNDSGYWGYYKDQNLWTAGMTDAQKQRYLQAISNSADFRLRYFWGIGSWYSRLYSNPVVTNDQIYQRFVQNNPNALDAACEPWRRNVRYERLLLVAPYIHSRYAGGFKGAIVSEFLLMPLGLSQNESRFVFEWDPIFQTVSVLPFLRDQDFLKLQD